MCVYVRVCRVVARWQQQQQSAGSSPDSRPLSAPKQTTSSLRAEQINLCSFTMADQRKFFVGGNWKMNGDKAAIDGIISFMKGPLSPDTGKCLRIGGLGAEHRLSWAKLTYCEI